MLENCAKQFHCWFARLLLQSLAMSVPAKRRRTAAVQENPRSRVLAVFEMTNSNDPTCFRLTEVAPPLSSTEHRSSKLRAARILDGVACISTPDGRDAIQRVQSGLTDRFLTSSQVLEHVLEDDEQAPPLCVLSLLLQNGDIRPSELPNDDLLARAYDLIVRENGRCCACPRRCAGSLSRIVSSLALYGQSRCRDEALSMFLRPLLQNGALVPAQGTYNDALRLSEQVLQDLKLADMDEGDRFSLLQSWIRASVVASPVSDNRPSSTPPPFCDDGEVRRISSWLVVVSCSR